MQLEFGPLAIAVRDALPRGAQFFSAVVHPAWNRSNGLSRNTSLPGDSMHGVMRW
jgi:hypothetical protein